MSRGNGRVEAAVLAALRERPHTALQLAERAAGGPLGNRAAALATVKRALRSLRRKGEPITARGEGGSPSLLWAAEAAWAAWVPRGERPDGANGDAARRRIAELEAAVAEAGRRIADLGAQLAEAREAKAALVSSRPSRKTMDFSEAKARVAEERRRLREAAAEHREIVAGLDEETQIHLAAIEVARGKLAEAKKRRLDWETRLAIVAPPSLRGNMPGKLLAGMHPDASEEIRNMSRALVERLRPIFEASSRQRRM